MKLLVLSMAVIASATANAASGSAQTWMLRFEAPSIVERAVAAGLPVRPTLAKADTLAPLKQAIQREQDAQLQAMANILGRPLKPKFVYQFGVNGMALELTAGEAEVLRSVAGVADVSADVVRSPHTDAGPRWIGTETVWSGVATGVPNRGEGVVVGIVDTGISAGHPSFSATSADGYTFTNPRGRRFGLCAGNASRCNNKLIGIHDFTQEGNRDGSDLNGHGTHVASIAVGNQFTGSMVAPTISLSLELSGVAPHANIISYKACIDNDASGSCPGSFTTAALDQAIADGVDVINYSIGGSADNPWVRLTQAGDIRSMMNARAAGIVVVVSAGNDGPLPGSIQSPANAPWVLAAANATHDRVFETELTDLSGDAPPRVSFKGQSLSAGMTTTASIVLGESVGSARCSVGNDLDSPPTGASNPFAAGSLSGLIVVCDRGIQARVAKSYNVLLGGGAGMVLVNAAADGDSVVPDGHSVPSTHLGADSGEVLKAWLRRTPNARGRITATRSVSDPGAADLVNSSSSRGPDLAGSGVLKPNLSAPGTGILAADYQSSGFQSLTGTSMSAPHIAGAAALVKAQHRDWGPDQIIAALVMSADDTLMRDGTGAASTPLIAGNGRTQVQRAVNAGLFLPLLRAGFDGNNPRLGGNPGSINLPELYSEDCRSQCSFSREFEGERTATWIVTSSVANGVRVTASPAQFTLAAGARQTVQFTVEVRDGRAIGRWNPGKVILSAVGESEASRLSLPVMVRSSAGSLAPRRELSVSAERGTVDLDLGGLVALPGAHFEVLGPAPATTEQFTLGADSDDSSDAFDVEAGTRTTFVTVGSGQSGLLAMTSGTQDLDLYVGADRNNDGVAVIGETLCSQRTPLAAEQCVLRGLVPGRYWIRVHNPAAAGGRSAKLEYAVLDAGKAHASGPARTADNETFGLRLSYDMGGAVAGSTRLAALFAYAGFDAADPFASQVIAVSKVASAQNPVLTLVAGQSKTVLVPANGTLDRIFLDTATASSLTLTASAAVQAQLLPGDPLPAQQSGLIAPTAGAGALSTATLSAVATVVPVPAGPRRYFLRLDNAGGAAVAVTLSRAQADPSAQNPATSILPGMYFNSARPGHGIFLSRARDDLQVAWYTYDSAGAPTFYLGFADNAFVGSSIKPQVTLALNRYSWDGTRALGQEVGTASITALGTQGLQWTWQLDQASGSEPMTRLAENACVETAGRSLDLSGLWFNPQQPGYGASVFTRPDLEIYAVYLYDGLGQPRWLWNDQNPFGTAQSPLYQYRGFCPGCTYTPVSRTEVGTLTRSYGPDLSAVSATVQPAGSWTIASGFNGGLPATPWNSSGVLEMLTAPGICR